MKWYKLFVICLLPILFLGCKDDVAAAGAGALDGEDQIRVCASALGSMRSRTDSLADFSITQTPDSFLLGECNTESWATIKADLLAQFACPAGTQFPDSSTIDSVAMVMTYSSWFGDGNSPLRITAYELDKATFDYDKVYTSQIDVNDYWSGDPNTRVVIAERTIVAAQNKDTVYSSELEKYLPYVRFMLNEHMVQKFNQIKRFPAQKDFNEFFKGLYITTNYGSSTALYVDNVTIILYYHYYYEEQKGSGVYKKNNDAKYLYANSEVRQVNRYSFPYKNIVLDELQKQEDSLNYVVSPAYVYTVLTLPMGAYVNQIKDSVDKLRPYMNKASMRVDVLNVIQNNSYANRWANPAPHMLLIYKDSIQSFFQNSKLPDEDYCLLSSLQYDVDSAYKYHYYYEFDMSTIMQNALRNEQVTLDTRYDVVMIPVDLEYATNSNSESVVSKVKINQTITYTQLRSAQFMEDPMDIDAVYSGFSITNMY